MGYPGYNRDPDSVYPAIDEHDKELSIQPKKVKSLIDDLKSDLDKYTTQHGALGLPHDLQTKVSAIQAKDIGGAESGDAKSAYPAAQKVFQMIKRVNDSQEGFPALYTQFINSYQGVINALYDSSGVIDDADKNSQVSNTGSQNTNQWSGADNQNQT